MIACSGQTAQHIKQKAMIHHEQEQVLCNEMRLSRLSKSAVLCEIIVRRAESYVRFGYDGDGLMTSAEGAAGLVNFRMRWYDPATGRWLSKDPIGLSCGLNLYAFCEGDPVNKTDPDGMSWKGVWDLIKEVVKNLKTYWGICLLQGRVKRLEDWSLCQA